MPGSPQPRRSVFIGEVLVEDWCWVRDLAGDFGKRLKYLNGAALNGDSIAKMGCNQL